jgi:hypothetical protein
MANVNPINGVPFGKEKTKAERLARAAWDLEQASKIRASKKPVGWEHLVAGHEKTARAYEALAREADGGLATSTGRRAHSTKQSLTKVPSFKISTKSTAAMTAAEINKELDKLDAQDSTLGDLMIEGGRGHERPSEYLRMTDPLSTELRKNSDRRQDLRIEIEMRYGPGAPSRLPTSKRGWYGPRSKTQSPTHGGMGFGKRYGGD